MANALRGFRISLGILFALLLIVFPTMIHHTTAPGSGMLGRYAPSFFVVLVAYLLTLVVLIGLATVASDSLLDCLLIPVRWLQRRPILWIVLALALLEGWFRVRGLLMARRFLYSQDYGIVLGFFGDRELTPVMLTLALAAVWLLFNVALAGRSGKDLKEAATSLGLGLASLALTFVVFANGYALLLNREDYLTGHIVWAELHTADPELGFRLVPNQSFDHLWDPDSQRFITVSTDSRGFRNPRDMAGAPLAVVGDSFIFGTPLSDDELWPLAFQAETGIEVANYGDIGYDPWQYNIIASRYVAAAHHDVVIYALTGTDLNDWRAFEVAPPLAYVDHRRNFGSPYRYTLSRLLNRSPVESAVRWAERLRQRGESGSSGHRTARGFEPACAPLVDYDYPALDYLYDKLDNSIELAQSAGYQLAFIAIPDKGTVYPEIYANCGPDAEDLFQYQSVVFDAVCAHLTERGIPCTNTTADFQAAAAATDQPLYQPNDDVHWTTEGGRVFAHLLADFLRREGLLPAGS